MCMRVLASRIRVCLNVLSIGVLCVNTQLAEDNPAKVAELYAKLVGMSHAHGQRFSLTALFTNADGVG